MTGTHNYIIVKTIFLCLIFLIIHANSIRALEELSADVQLLVKALQDQDVRVRRDAAASLEGLGESANAAVPALIDRLSDPDAHVRRNAAAALEKIGAKAEPAVPALVKLLNDIQPAVRQVAAKTLGSLEEKAAAAVPGLISICDDVNPYARYQALLALFQIARKANTVDPALISALKSHNSRIRFAAATALGEMRKNAASASSELVAVLNDEDYGVGTKAAEALMHIGSDAVPALMAALKDESAPPRTRRIAASVLGQSRLKDESNLWTLIAMLNSNDTWIRAFAADLIAGIGPKARAAAPDLVQVLNDESVEVRRKAARALEKIGSDAVTALREALKAEDAMVRIYVAKTLGEIGAKAAPAVPALVAAMTEETTAVRGHAAAALGKIGTAAEAAVPALLKALKDRSAFVRGNAALALGKITSSEIIDIVAVLQDEDAYVRRNSAKALQLIGPQAKSAAQALIPLLKDEDESVRKQASDALNKIGMKAEKALPILSQALGDENPSIRQYAAESVGRLGRQASPAAPALARALADEDANVRRAAATALGKIGPDAKEAVPDLMSALRDRDVNVAAAAASALGNFRAAARPAIPALERALVEGDINLRRAAAVALGKTGADAGPAVPALIQALMDQDKNLRYDAARALAGIGSQAAAAVSALIDALKSNDRRLSGNAEAALRQIGSPAVAELTTLLQDDKAVHQISAARILGTIGPDAASAVGGLTRALSDENISLRQTAARSLGLIGTAAASAVPLLTNLLDDKDAGLKRNAAASLGEIAMALRDASVTDMIEELTTAGDKLTFMAQTDANFTTHALNVRRAIEFLELASWQQAKKEALAWIQKHSFISIGIPLYIIWVLAWLIILRVRPLVLLRINQALKPLDVKLPDRLGGIKFPLRTLLVVGLLNYRPSVLDAWVHKHIGTVRERFRERDTVRDRQVHINVPVQLDSRTMPNFTRKLLKPTFERRIGYLLIWGEGGSGKTSLACQIARWAMSEVRSERLCEHLMIPVLIEHELDPDNTREHHRLTESVAKQLQDLTDQFEPIADELVERLLRHRRLLVIIDHLSEMSAATRSIVHKELSSFPANALIITSRLREKLDGMTKTTIKPMRIAGNHLSSFMEAYLTSRDKRELFSDAEFFGACGRLSAMVGERDITVLLAKLYAEEMIAAKKSIPSVDLPDTIPDLILSYLNELNRGVTEARLDDRIVHRDAKVVAWECLKKTFRPDAASYDKIIAALGRDDADVHLKYLQDRLRLIQSVQPAQDRLRLVLDPLAEYLAAFHVVTEYGEKEEAWHQFFKEADGKEGAPQTISGFLLAIRDCCISGGRDIRIPEFVVPELGKRAGLQSRESAYRFFA